MGRFSNGLRMPPSSDAAERLFRRTLREPGGCWLWTGALDGQGYGRIRIAGRTVITHRLAYELMVQAIPPGAQLDHLCHTHDESCPGGLDCGHRRCINPAHLEPVTTAENTRRGRPASKSHCVRGHLLAGDNVRISVSAKGYRRRVCRACAAARAKAWHEAKKVAA